MIYDSKQTPTQAGLFKTRIDLEDLNGGPLAEKRLLQFGSLFSGARLNLANADNRQEYERTFNGVILANDGIDGISDQVRDLLGSYVAIHARTGSQERGSVFWVSSFLLESAIANSRSTFLPFGSFDSKNAERSKAQHDLDLPQAYACCAWPQSQRSRPPRPRIVVERGPSAQPTFRCFESETSNSLARCRRSGGTRWERSVTSRSPKERRTPVCADTVSASSQTALPFAPLPQAFVAIERPNTFPTQHTPVHRDRLSFAFDRAVSPNLLRQLSLSLCPRRLYFSHLWSERRRGTGIGAPRKGRRARMAERL